MMKDKYIHLDEAKRLFKVSSNENLHIKVSEDNLELLFFYRGYVARNETIDALAEADIDDPNPMIAFRNGHTGGSCTEKIISTGHQCFYCESWFVYKPTKEANALIDGSDEILVAEVKKVIESQDDELKKGSYVSFFKCAFAPDESVRRVIPNDLKRTDYTLTITRQMLHIATSQFKPNNKMTYRKFVDKYYIELIMLGAIFESLSNHKTLTKEKIRELMVDLNPTIDGKGYSRGTLRKVFSIATGLINKEPDKNYFQGNPQEILVGVFTVIELEQHTLDFTQITQLILESSISKSISINDIRNTIVQSNNLIKYK